MAEPIEKIWPLFIEFVEGKLEGGKRVRIIVAWGGQACDCEWLFRITEESHHGTLVMPKWCPYFFDPKKTIMHYKSCKLNSKHSGVIGYGLEEVYCHLAGKDYLEGAHSSIVDAFAQSYIVGHECFVEFWDKPV